MSWQKSSSSTDEHKHGLSSRMFLILQDKGRLRGGRGSHWMFLSLPLFLTRKEVKQQSCFSALPCSLQRKWPLRSRAASRRLSPHLGTSARLSIRMEQHHCTAAAGRDQPRSIQTAAPVRADHRACRACINVPLAALHRVLNKYQPLEVFPSL